jgi:hypothetical protein
MITLEVQSKKLSKSVSIFPDDTIEVVKQRIGAEFNISPNSMLLIVSTKQRNWNESLWENMFNNLSNNGEVSQTILQNWLSNIVPIHTVGRFDPITKDVWNSRSMPILEKIFETAYSEYLQIGFQPEDNKGVYPIPLLVPSESYCEGSSVVAINSRKIWADMNYETNIILREIDEFLKVPCWKLYFPSARSLVVEPIEEELKIRLKAESDRINKIHKLLNAGPISYEEDRIDSTTEITVMGRTMEKYVERLDKKYSSNKINFGFLRIRFNQYYNKSLRPINIEQLFYALMVSEDIPIIEYCPNTVQAPIYKMYSKNKEVFIKPNEFRRWTERISYSRSEPIVLLYFKKKLDDVRSPCIRLGVTADKLYWTIDNTGITGLKFYYSEIVYYANVLVEYLSKIIVGLEIDESSWEITESTTELSVDRSFGGRMGMSQTQAVVKCMEDYFYGVPGTDDSIPTFIYKRISNFGTKNEGDELILEQINSGMSNDDVMKVYSSKFPILDNAERERVYSRIMELREGHDRAFISVVSLKFVDTQTMQISGIRSKNQMDSIIGFCNSFFLFMFPKSQTEEQKKLFEMTCPKPSKIIKGKKKEEAPVVDEFDIFGMLDDMFMDKTIEGTKDMSDVKENRDEKDLVNVVEDKDERSEDHPEMISQSGSTHKYILRRLEERDKKRFIYKAKTPADRYPKICSQERQPISYTPTEWNMLQSDDVKSKFIKKYLEDSERYVLEDDEMNNKYICPEYFCITDEIPLDEGDLIDKKCPICGGKIIPDLPSDKLSKLDFIEYSVLAKNSAAKFPRMNSKTLKKDFHMALPCCYDSYKKGDEKRKSSKLEQDYILGDDKFPLDQDKKRFGLLPKEAEDFLGVSSVGIFGTGLQRIMKVGTKALLRMSRPNPVVMNTVKELLKEYPSIEEDEFIKIFAELNNGNLIRIYGDNWSEDHPEREEFNDWASKRGIEVDNKRVFKIWTGERIYKKKIYSENLPITHVWDLIQRITGSKLLVLHYNGSGNSISLRCPPIGALFEGDSYIMFFEKDGFYEQIVVGVRERTAFKYLNKINPENLKDIGFNIDLPLSVWSKCRPYSTESPSWYIKPKLISEYFEEDVFIIDPYSRIVSIVDSSNNIFPYYPTSVPAYNSNSIQYGYEYETLPEVMTEYTALMNGEDFQKPHSWILIDREPKMIVAIETVSMLRVPVKPTPMSKSIPSLNEILLDSYNMNEDMILAFPDKPKSVDVLEKVKRDDQIRDWVLYQFSEYLRVNAKFRDIMEKTEKVTKSVKDMIGMWIMENISPVGSSDPTIPKLKNVCSSLSENNCSGACVFDKGTCKISTRGTDLTQMDILEWILYSVFEDPKKRYLILNGEYPKVSSMLYWEMENEVIFSKLDPYPDYVGKECSKKMLFDEPDTQEQCD